jgi:hypothetical protein
MKYTATMIAADGHPVLTLEQVPANPRYMFIGTEPDVDGNVPVGGADDPDDIDYPHNLFRRVVAVHLDPLNGAVLYVADDR